MPKKPKRIFNADHIAQGVGAVAQLQQEALKVAPHMAGPMSRIPMQPQPVPEMLEGHCLGCQTKRKFAVEGEQTMKNGTIRKYGKCENGTCGRMISLFVSGAKDGAA